MDAAAFAEARALWDAGRAREAHEAWEALWRLLPRDSPEAAFLKALCCGTAAVVKAAEGSPAVGLLVERTDAAFARAPAALGGLAAVTFRADVLRRAGPA